jgi:PTS system mannose-specific IID component
MRGKLRMDKESRIKLSKKDVVKAFWRWTFFSHANYNYERLEATGMVFSLSPIIKKLYGGNEKEYKAAIKRHMNFYNTEPHFGGIINGMVIAMEEERANGAPITDEAINGIKTGLMGPLAGIGDTLWQGTLTPIYLAFGISLGITGNLMGPILYTLLMFGTMFPIAYIVWMKGYKLGREGVQKILEGNLLKTVMTAASTMGAIVLGALTANFVNITSPAVIKVGKASLKLQADILDKLMLNIIPLLVTLGTLYLLKKQKKSTTVLLYLIVLGVVGGVLGIF